MIAYLLREQNLVPPTGYSTGASCSCDYVEALVPPWLREKTSPLSIEILSPETQAAFRAVESRYLSPMSGDHHDIDGFFSNMIELLENHPDYARVVDPRPGCLE